MIYIVVPEYVIRCLGDYLTNFLYYLETCHIECQMVIYDETTRMMKELGDSVLIYVSILPRKLSSKVEYYLNIDQFLHTPNLVWGKHYDLILQGEFPMLDYSRENIEILKKYDLCRSSLFIPYIYNPNDTIFKVGNIKKEYDVCLLGSDTERRIQMYRMLQSHNINVINVTNKFGIDRDIEICKSKILLNIHAFDNSDILESIRCYPAIFNKIIVLSENSNYDKSILINDMILYAEYDDIPNMIKKILSSYEDTYNTIFNENPNKLNEAIEQLSSLMEASVQEFVKINL